jgi:hypothetical protein
MKPPGLQLSTVVLVSMAAIGGVLLASIYAFILVAIPTLTSQLWWMGLASAIFALAFLVLYAATSNRQIVRPLAGVFFLLSAGSFYGSILTAPEDGLRFLWFVLLSILVVIVLAAIFVLTRQGEAAAARRAQRRITP